MKGNHVFYSQNQSVKLWDRRQKKITQEFKVRGLWL